MIKATLSVNAVNLEKKVNPEDRVLKDEKAPMVVQGMSALVGTMGSRGFLEHLVILEKKERGEFQALMGQKVGQAYLAQCRIYENGRRF